jgi:hypothetical protein
MKSCTICQLFNGDECGHYRRTPPTTFAERCKHYAQIEEYVAPTVVVTPVCEGCGHNCDGWCRRFDLPEWEYNFVKIREGNICPRQ